MTMPEVVASESKIIFLLSDFPYLFSSTKIANAFSIMRNLDNNIIFRGASGWGRGTGGTPVGLSCGKRVSWGRRVVMGLDMG